MYLKKALLFALIGYAGNIYAQEDTSNFKLDLGNPAFGIGNKYNVPKETLYKLSPDSVLFLIDDKIYTLREVKMMQLTDSALIEFTKNIESLNIEQNQKSVDSIVSRQIKRVIIIRNKKQ